MEKKDTTFRTAATTRLRERMGVPTTFDFVLMILEARRPLCCFTLTSFLCPYFFIYKMIR